jgi:hypothetical protein
MYASLRALLAGVIDYAGLFPPAQLSLDQSIRNYARYRQEAESWMLGRFVCPAERLAELVPYLDELFREGPPLICSALGQATFGGVDWHAAAWESLQCIAAFRQKAAGRALVDVIEMKAAARVNFNRAFPFYEQIEELQGDKLMPYIEAEPDNRWRVPDGHSVFHWALLSRPRYPLGLKMRCGGLQASAFPEPKQIALMIVPCRNAAIPVKFTAGLHHPIRQFDSGLQTHMHGFINVFVAGVLAHARRLEERQVQEIIEDENPQDFVFDDKSLRWKDWHATTEEIAVARRQVVSFGSCSFDEPRADLRKLAWLE